jgi:hypothetical protein
MPSRLCQFQWVQMGDGYRSGDRGSDRPEGSSPESRGFLWRKRLDPQGGWHSREGRKEE